MSAQNPMPSFATLLLKTRSKPSDPYSILPSPSYVPVLTHTLLPSALDTLIELFASSPSSPSSFVARYSGLIITSQRAVEALGAAFARLATVATANLSTIKQQLESLYTVVYVVGPATGQAVQALLSAWIPRVQVEGEGSGSGEALARLILERHGEQWRRQQQQRRQAGGEGGEPEQRSKPLLFLVGEQRRDIIPRTLMSESLPLEDKVGVEELIVYETQERETFADDFHRQLDLTETEDVRWVVVFSPTGCKAMLRVLGWLDSDERFDQKIREKERKAYIASIGPTTRDFLRDTFGIKVDVCAVKPSPEGLRDGIEKFMAQDTTRFVA